MCGINGILRLRDNLPHIDKNELLLTRDNMLRRGPDSKGAWLSSDGEVALANRRLAILDLSDAGLQPMVSEDGRYHITFNGEIYNYRDLRAGLQREGIVFKSNSDTEVILTLFARQKRKMFAHLRGMFAFAIWDSVDHELTLARDPFGIKPLYYSIVDGYFRFASQVRALEAGGKISKEVDPAGLVGFLLWGSVPEPFTIRRAVRALPAGHYMTVKNGSAGDPCPFHDWKNDMSSWLLEGTEVKAVSEAIQDSIKSHLVSDVPVGIFLSAGLDSSLITAVSRRFLPEPPITFTLRFEELANTPFDEAPIAALIAKKMGTQHIEKTVAKEDFLEVWDDAMEQMDQPSIDGFQVYLISKFAHDAGLKVALSGLGGDELFGSYSSFKTIPRILRIAKKLYSIPFLKESWPCLSKCVKPNREKYAGLLNYGTSLPGAYFLFRGLFHQNEIESLIDKSIAIQGLAAYDPLGDAGKYVNGADACWNNIQLMELTQYMLNQLLPVTDWASMAHSLEIRVPLVDVCLFRQLAANNFEPAKSSGKAALVRSLAPELPEILWNRPKTGFYIPVEDWIHQSSERIPGFSGLPSFGHASRRLALLTLSKFVDRDIMSRLSKSGKR